MNFLKPILLLLLLFYTADAKETVLEPVTLQLQWKHQFEFAGFYAAKEKGFYRDAGLDVTFVEFDKTKSITGEVLNGNAEYGLTYSSIIVEYLEGKPFVLLANFFKQSPLVLVAQPDIKTPADLKGKKVMGVSDSIHNITLLTMLNKFGVHSQDIVSLPTNFKIDDFISKKIDAMSVFTTNELYYLDQRGVKYNLFDPVAYGAKYYDANLFTTQKELLEHPQRVKRFREASIKGWEYALEHQDEIIEIILNKYNTQYKSKDALQFEAKQIEYIMLPDVYKVGSVDVDRVKIIVENFIQAGFIDNFENREIESFVYEHEINPLGLTDSEIVFIKKHPQIVLGTDRAWKPYVIQNDDGTISGYDADVLALINRASGANFVLKTGDWSQMQIEAQSREIDGLSTGGVHEERKHYLNFSDIYISMRKMLITTKENPENIQTLHDLDGKTIAVHSSNLVDLKIAKKFPKSKVLKLESIEEVISSVVTGKADAMFGNGAVFYLANDLGMPYLKRSAMLDDTLELAFGVRKDWPEAISIINKSLAYIGEYKMLELKSRWFWEGASTAVDKTYKKLQLTDAEEAYLQHKKVITMCVDPDWMPFEKIEKGRHKGLTADYMKLVSKKIHMPISLVETRSWSDSLIKAKDRECDILSMVAKTEEKEKYMDFTSTYIESPLVLATRHDQLFIEDIDSYMDKKWGVVKGYSVTDILKKRYPSIRVVEVDSVHDGLKLVENGTLFGYIDNAIVVSSAIQKEFFGSISITGRLESKVRYSVAIRNDEKILRDVFEKAVLSIEPDEMQRLLDKWVKVDYSPQKDYTLVWQVFVVTSLIILIIFYRYVLLRREVGKRVEAEEKLQQLTSTLSEQVNHATIDLEEKNLRLIESVYNFEDIFNTTMEMIVIFEDDGTIIDMNQSGLKMLGYYYKSEIVGTKISRHVLESELPRVYEDLRMDTHEPYELIILRRDGSQLYTLMSSRRIIRDGRKVRLSTLMDLTEVRQQNSHLIQQSKMAAMGEMIENIAHQWRQPLSQVNSAVLLVDGLLDKRDIQDEQIEAKLSEIEELTKYMSTTINDFKDFFVQEKKVVSFVLSDVVNKAVNIASSSLKSSHIDLQLLIDEEIIMQGYSNELQQVILVLINNAKDVLKSRENAAPKIVIRLGKEDTYAFISVSDNAGGIEDDIIGKVFEPYFTTKQQTQGTGLGLYISKMIIQESMNGSLEVENRNAGACFTIRLPIVLV